MYTKFIQRKWLFLSIFMVVMASLVFVAPGRASTAVSFFNDGFESGDFSAWNVPGTNWSISSSDAASGTKKSVVIGSVDGSSLGKNISTQGYETIQLSYSYKILESLEGNDSVVVEWSSDGTNWNSVADHHNLSSGAWTVNTVSLTAGANNNPNFRFRFKASLGSSSDKFALDNVYLSGTQILSTTNSTISGNTPIIADGGQSTIVIVLKDQFNNPIAGIPADQISISASGTGNTVVQPNTATNASGQTTGTLSSTVAGEKVITVVVGSVTLNSHPVVLVNPGIAANATITADPSDTVEANLAGLSVVLRIVISDGHGNLASNGTVVSVSSDKGIVSGTGDTVGGLVTRTLSYNNKGDVNLKVNVGHNLILIGAGVIHFVDNTKPIITINPSNPATVEFRTLYTDTGATAFDNIDGNISSSIITINPVDSSAVLNTVVNPADKIVSTYQVKYNVKDTSNNTAVEAVRTVNVVDTAAPVLYSITSNATSADALKIGDSIIFTLTPAMAEPIATVSGSYNGHALTWVTANAGVTYTATYTVTADDIDQFIPLQITGVTMTDEAGNVSLPADGCDVQKTIDANAPLAPVVELPEYINIANKNSVAIKFTGEANTTGSYVITDTDPVTDDLFGDFALSSSGTLTLDFDLTSQVEGAITVSANLKDAAGNIGVSGTDTAIKDTVAPIAPTPVLPTWINIINQTAPAISGAGEANALISYAITDSLASTVSGTGTVGSTGVINLVGSDISGLADGDLSISMNLTDAAGNLGLAGVSISKKETIKPTLASIDSDGKTYKVGEYDITATFSEAVTSPKIAISFSEKVGTCADISATAMTATTDQKIYTYHLIVDDACDATLGTITISNATDIPGNIIEANVLHSFNVDTLAPVFSAITPATDSFIKADFNVAYTLSENLLAGTIGFAASPVQTYTLTGAQLTAGSHTITSAELASGGIAMTDGSTYSIIFNGTDLVGNNSLTVTNTGIKYDTTAPAVINITSTKANGAYKAGENIVVTIQFSEPVNATYYHLDWGCGYWGDHCHDEINTFPYITLETGTTDRNVNYTSGSGTDTLTFNYTVQAGDINPDLDYISANALNLNGQTIRDFSGNDANVVLSTPGAEGSLGANKNIVIDTIAPVISAHTDLVVEATDINGALMEYVLPTASDSINGSVTVSCSPVSGSQFALNNTTVTCTSADALGNTATSNFKITVKDTTAPTITAPADINMPANAWLSTVALGIPVVSDAVDTAPVVTNNAPATFPVGTTVVTWTVTDSSNNYSTATQNVTIVPAPIAQLDVNAETPKTTDEVSLVTVNGKDAFGHITTNQSGSIVTVNVDNGGSLSSSIIILADGVATTNLSKLSAGIVNINVISGILTPDSTKVTFTAADTSGPAVTQINPLKDAVNVAISSPLFLIFNEPLKSESISSSNIKLMKVATGTMSVDEAVSASVSLSEGDVRVNVNPNSSLDFSSQYYFVVSGIADKTGNVMTAEIGKENSGFTTAADTADHTAPTVATAWPSGSAVEIGVNPYVDFSETMKLSTLTEDNIRLFKVGSVVSVPAVVVVQNGGTRVEIQPVLNLDYETVYYISVSANVSDEAGNKLSADYISAQFTTVSEPTAELVVTNIANVKSWAKAGGGFVQGWKWRFDVTVPTAEEKFYMRFNDWTNGASGVIPANGNIRYYTAQGDHGIDSPITVTGNGYPTTPIILNSDLDTSSAGKQIQVYVEVQVPDGSADGSYSTSYQIMSKTLEDMPV